MKSTVFPSQLAMFEPSGSELATLARTHAGIFSKLERSASVLDLRGFASAASVYRRQSLESLERSFVCELTLQFESLAGLS